MPVSKFLLNISITAICCVIPASKENLISFSVDLYDSLYS